MRNPFQRRRADGRITGGLSTRGRRRRRTGLAALCVAGLVAAGGVVVFSGVLNWCPDDLFEHDGECVGVSDGTASFGPDFVHVEAKIREENQRIAGQRGVTIALLLPITQPPDSDRPTNNLLSVEQIRAQLEGAYTAQRVNNDEHDLKVRLVVANEGSQEQAWAPVVDQLAQQVSAPQPLVAVTGLGVSVQQTVAGAQDLSRRGIPMVGAVITADELNATDIGAYGLVRVNPGNGDQLDALAEFLPSRPELRNAMLVADSNQADFYTRDLAEGFQDKLGRWRAPDSPIMPYQGKPGSPGISTQFNNIAGRLCGSSPPDMVFYAGRAALLPDFVTQLRQRGCAKDRAVTVVTGSDASNLQVALGPPAQTDAPVSVIYTGLAEPKALADPRWNPEHHGQYRRFEEAFRNSGFPAEDLRNGWAIMQHDAILTAATATHKAVGQLLFRPGPADVLPQLYLLNDASTRVHGAGGSFNIDSTTGNAVGRRIPILELTPEGQIEVLDVHDDL